MYLSPVAQTIRNRESKQKIEPAQDLASIGSQEEDILNVYQCLLRIGVVRGAPDGLSEALGGFGKPILAAEYQAQIVICLVDTSARATGRQSMGSLDLLQPPLSSLNCSQKDIVSRVIWIFVDCLLIPSFGE